MRHLFSKTVFDCRQATFLSVKKEEGTITLPERIKLSYHLFYCGPCRRFIDQWKLLSQKNRERTFFSRRPPFSLPPEVRDRIRRQLYQLNP